MRDKFYFVSGAFIASGVFVIIIVLFIFSKDLHIFNPSSSIYAVFENVSELKQGAMVNLSGYHIGNVRSVKFNDTGDILVEMDIMNEYLQYLSDDSLATIGTTGLLGDKAVFINRGRSSRSLSKDMFLHTKEPFEIDEALAGISDIITHLNQVLADAQTITGKLAEEYDSIVGSAESLTRIFHYIESGEGNIGRLINDDSLYNSLLTSAETIASTAKNLENLSFNINRTFLEMEGEFEFFGEFTNNLKLASNNLYIGMKLFPEVMTDLHDIIEYAKFTFQGLQRNPLIGPFISVAGRRVENTHFELLGD